MPITADYHLHSSFSGDSDTPMEEMIQKGIALGLTRMCFTEHHDLDYPVTESTPAGFFELNPDAFLYDFLKLKEKYADRITLCFGVELGMQPHLARQNAAFSKAHDYDFIIASSHLCNGKDPYYPAFYEGRSQDEAYLEYFASIPANLQAFDNFDVYGHLDYVVRYGPNQNRDYSYKKYGDIIDPILKNLTETGRGLECNTGGYKYGLGHPNPAEDVLKRYLELGGEIITIGSDAHEPKHLGFDFARARRVLKDIGFRYYAVYESRKPHFYSL